jgi:hypothetical protein
LRTLLTTGDKIIEYPEYKPENIYEDLRKILTEEALSASLFERINNAIDPYIFASDISQEEVP